MKTKHTPEPWEKEDWDTDHHGEWPFSIEASSVTIACVSGIGGEADANAKLIADSPVLLRVAKKVLAQHDGDIIPNGPDWDELRALILKIES